MEVLAADLGLFGRVQFVGLRRDVPDIIRVARVTVLTSEIEGFPSILLEAQLAGCPVVATRAGGTSEIVEDDVTGFLVEIGDHAAVASKVARLIDDPALAAEAWAAPGRRGRADSSARPAWARKRSGSTASWRRDEGSESTRQVVLAFSMSASTRSYAFRRRPIALQPRPGRRATRSNSMASNQPLISSGRWRPSMGATSRSNCSATSMRKGMSA